MEQPQQVLRDPFFWVAVASALAAWAAAWMAKRTLNLAERQERQRRQHLVAYLVQGYCKAIKDARVFTFSISVSNPSDTDNSLAQLELQVSYSTVEGLCMAVKVPYNSTLVRHLRYQPTVLSPPVRIDAHQTIAGSALFEVADALVGSAKIEGYTLLLTDTHGATTKVEQVIVSELADEEEKSENQDWTPQGSPTHQARD